MSIPPGPLGPALIRLAEEARISIGLADPGISHVRTRGIRGRMTLSAALQRLLAGTGYTYVFVGAGAVRIVPAPKVANRPPPARTAPAPAPASQEPEIIVSASKQAVALDRFAGTVQLLDLRPEDSARAGARGSEAILSRLPILASTSLGPGRNKLYIRGVADSSFNGPSQSLVGQYLGEARLTFNAPDPDLRLYDIRRVEVLEGPQGALYGTGTLGGILRLVPNDPDPDSFSGSVSEGVSSTRHGSWSGDAAGIVNLPVVRGRLALRAVAYASREGGYIDDLQRRRGDVNSTRVEGARVALLWAPGGGWKVEVGGLVQTIAARDGQYAMRGLPLLSRRSSLPQPFDNDYALAYLTARKRWDALELISTTSLVRHTLESQFDATGFPGTTGPQLYTEDTGITLLTNETRLSRPSERGEGWVVGWSLVRDLNRISRSLGTPAAPAPIAGVRNALTEAALFGEYSQALTSRLTATIGGRLTFSEASGAPLDAPEDLRAPRRRDVRATPAAALTWRPRDRSLVFVRYQQGHRAGGLAVSGAAPTIAATRFESDSLSSYETGIRVGRQGHDPLAFAATASLARWSDMQADLIDALGLPFTTNLGDGRIYGIELSATWRLTRSLRLELAGFANDSALTKPRPGFLAARDSDLPNIADAGARAAAHYETQLSPSASLSLDGSLRYVGRSKLGISPTLQIPQGGFLDGELGGRIDFRRFAVSLDVTNVADVRGNRFSFGNPFTVTDARQVTPLRPRTVRVDFDVGF